jgi:eukaryotic-like serine/threonine-protein kinase
VTAAPAPSNDLVGAILSQKYPLKRLIGSGGMGSVYESQSPEDGKRLAIKVLAVEYLHEEDVKLRFLDEGRMCQRLIHPNIVRVFDTAQAEDGTPYIVMEMLDGVPLSAYTRSGVRVPMPQAAAILQGILAGLGAAHAQAIVHRDLKPENVVLARDPAGGAFAAKILDFGIAKVMDAAGGMGSKTRTGVLLGTPAYMSPEQIKNAKEVDARTDLWSAGVMLYEMLTGRVAFPAPTEYARLSAVLNNNPPPLESVDPQLSRLSAFVQLAMQKDREKRFQTALEMSRALTAAVGAADVGPTTSASPGASPLSRLPDVPSVWMPVGLAPNAAGAPTGRVPSAPPPAATQTNPPPGPGADATMPSKGPGGTLASKMGHSPSGHPPAPHVAIIGASHGTLPSENLPMFAPARGKRGIAVSVVVVLVLLGIVAGFLLGLAAARLH